MVKFIRKVLVFVVLPISVLYIGVELLLRQIPNDYYFKNKKILESAEEIEILAVGGSQVYFGINPRYFNLKSFNISHVSQDLKYDLALIDKFLPKMEKVKFLIVSVPYGKYSYSLENSEENWRIKNYNIYYDVKSKRKELKYNLAFFSDNLLTSIKRIGKFYYYDIDEIYCSKSGFGLDYSLDKKLEDWELQGAIAAKRHNNEINDKYLDDNLEYLFDIINKCSERNIEVILITTPVWNSYYEKLNFKELELEVAISKNISLKENVNYINLINDKRFIADDFFDADHLSNIGSKKLTNILNDTLKTMN